MAKKKARYTTIIPGMIFWFAQNCWFGWNSEPCCTAEEICDKIVAYMIIFGIAQILIRDEVRSQLSNSKEEKSEDPEKTS